MRDYAYSAACDRLAAAAIAAAKTAETGAQLKAHLDRAAFYWKLSKQALAED